MDDRKNLNIDILKNIDLFADLPFPALDRLADLFYERVFRKGETVFPEESVGSSMMIIVSGEVRISQLSPSNTEETLVVLKKGDFFGEMALLEDMPRSASAIAHTDIFVLEISRERFMTLLEKDPESGVRVLLILARKLSSRLREADVKIKTFVNLTQWL
jgi:CRP/FNR family transcriptional regulator, cyclic AMP receptor protein